MKKGLLAFCLIFSGMAIWAQPDGTQKTGVVSDAVSFWADNAPAYIRGKVHLPGNDGQVITGIGKVITEETDGLGQTHYRTQQTINGLPVEGAIFIEHVTGTKVLFSNGIWIKNVPAGLAASASLPKEAALQKALQKVAAAKYMWQDAGKEAMLKEETGNPNSSFYPTAQLVYYSGEGAPDPAKLRLAYKFDVYALEPLSRQYIFIDAANGAVLGTQSILHTTATPATAVTGYSGNQSIITDSYNSSYRLRDSTRGKGIVTYNKATNGDFTNTTTTWNNVNAQKDQYATDAHWGAEKYYDYFKIRYGRNSIDNAGFSLRSYMHDNGAGSFNAYWDGYRMAYGDGSSANGNRPLTALDVCGHEITHGLTEKTSGLIYSYSNESGALNEGFSDIFGTALEAYARPGQWDWLIGGDFYTIRSMSNPNAYSQPDTYNGRYWNPSNPHYNSGVLNYWFYLLSAGGTGTNDKGCAFNVTGIGIDKAAAIAYRTNTTYLGPNSTFADAAKFSLRSARELYGQFSNEATQTGAAWIAVNVQVAPLAPTINPVTVACAGQNITLSLATGELNTGGQWKWYTGSCGGTLIDSGASVTVRPTVATTYYVRAAGSCSTAASTCASVTVTPKAGPPTPTILAGGPTSFCSGGQVALYTGGGQGIGFRWSNGVTTQSNFITTSGTYTVQLIDIEGCLSAVSAPKTVTVYPAPPTPVITASGPLSFCPGGNVTLTAPAGYTYLWSSGATTRTVLVTGTGSYRVTVTNSSGCSATSAYTATTLSPAPPKPAIAASGPLTFNQGGSVTLSVPAGFSHYEWSNGGTGPSITVTASGYYNCDVYNANGCSNTSNTVQVVVIPLPDQPEIIASGPLSFCQGGSVTLTAPAGFAAYAWSNGATTQSINVSSSGAYNVKVTNSTGGISPASDNVIINVKAVPAKSVIALDGPATFCTGDDVTLSGPVGFASYQWSNGAATSAITTSTSGTYSLIVTNTGGCASPASNPVQVTVNETPAKPVVTANGPVTFCAGNSVVLNAPAGFATYQWSNGATTATITVNEGDDYSVRVTNASGCASPVSDAVLVTVNETPEKPVITIGGSTDICEGSSVTLSAPAGYATYVWSNGANTQSINATTAGNYSVTVGTAAGCSSVSSDAVPVTVNPLPAAPVIANVTAYQGTGNIVLSAANCSGILIWINPDNTTGAGSQINVPTTIAGNYTYKVACQGTCTSPYTTVTVTVLPTLISVSHLDGDNNQAANNTIRPYLRLNNESNTAIPYKELSVRYWLTAENYAPLTNLSVYYAQLGTSYVNVKYVKTDVRQGAFGYVEYTFTTAAGNLPANNNSGPIQSGVAKQDWTVFNELDDYSFASNTAYTKTNKITVYRNGSLIWGIEPSPVAPVTSLAAYAQNQNSATNTNTIRTYLKVNNEGNQPVSYKDITVRYWFTADGNSPLKYNLDYAQLGNNNVTGSFITMPTPVDKADTYLQLSFPNLTDSLYPISSTGNIQQRINKQDWSAFNETNDHSFKIAGPMALNNLMTIYIKGELVFGVEPVIHSMYKPNETPVAEPFHVRVLQNPLEGNEMQVVITGAKGKSLQMQVVDGSGRLLTERQIKNAGATEFQRIPVADNAAQIIYLRVSTPDAFKIIKVLKAHPYQ